MSMLTVILLVIVADRIEAACSMPARKLAGAAIAAASKLRSIVKPLLEVSATTDPGPPGPEALTAAAASTDSAGRTGAWGVETDGDAPMEEVTLLWLVSNPDVKGKRFAKSLVPKSLFWSCGSKARCNLIAFPWYLTRNYFSGVTLYAQTQRGRIATAIGTIATVIYADTVLPSVNLQFRTLEQLTALVHRQMTMHAGEFTMPSQGLGNNKVAERSSTISG